MPLNPLHDLTPGTNPPQEIHVVVEIPKGCRNKYELNKMTGMFELSRTLYSPMIYPGEYGLIPQTHYEDGDPLDAIVMINEPTFTGCVIEARPVGIFRMLDKGEPDDKILCVPIHNPFFNNIFNLKDIPPHFLREVAHFFSVYKDLEGSRVLSLGWEDVDVAHRQIEHSISLYRKKTQSSQKLLSKAGASAGSAILGGKPEKAPKKGKKVQKPAKAQKGKKG